MGLADGFADLDEFPGEVAETLVLGELGAGAVDGVGGNGTGGLAAGAADADEQPVGSMARVVVSGAAAGGLAAFLVAVEQGAWAQIAQGGEFLAELVAPRFQRGEVGRDRHGRALLSSIYSRLKIFCH